MRMTKTVPSFSQVCRLSLRNAILGCFSGSSMNANADQFDGRSGASTVELELGKIFDKILFSVELLNSSQNVMN